MKTIDRTPSTDSYLFLLAKSAALISGVFVFLVCCLMVSNHFRMKRVDPIHSPSLERMIRESEANPHDEALKEEIRELDLLARRAFFQSRHFNQTGIYLLLGGLTVFFIALKSLKSATHQTILPPPAGETKNWVHVAQASRRYVGVGAFVLVGATLWLTLSSDLQVADIPLEEEKAPEAEAAAVAVVPSLDEMKANWVALRGMDSLGFAEVKKAPTSWNGETGEGIVWKVPVELPGFNSPIVWGEKLFLSGGDKTRQSVYCYALDDGRLLWSTDVQGVEGEPAEPPRVTNDTGFAAATMTTNGHLVFAIFANGNLAALDYEGKVVWARNLGKPKNPYGHSSSLLLHKDLLLVQFDHNDAASVFGIEILDGKTRWETKREYGVSWASPVLIRTSEVPELITMANPMVVSYNPETGAENWKVECLGGEVAVSGAFQSGKLFAMAEYYRLCAIDMTTHEIVWEVEDELSGVSSPVAGKNSLVIGLGDGSMIARDPATGEELWYEETDFGFYASPVLVGDLIYLMDRSGVMHIFKDAPQFERVGSPSLGEDAVATPAFIGEHIYIRGVKNLFKIGGTS